MQAGYATNAGHLGTNLEVPLTPASTGTSYAQAVFDQSLAGVEGVNERNIVYPKFAPALAGMSLTKVPTGGFSGPPPNILLGADLGGAMFNASNPTYFNQPGYTGGCGKYAEVGNGVPLTGERPGAELVYMAADGKLRDPRGASTTARAAQEAAQGRRRQARAHADMYGGGTYGGGGSGGGGDVSGTNGNAAFPDTSYAPQGALLASVGGGAPSPVSAPVSAPVRAPIPRTRGGTALANVGNGGNGSRSGGIGSRSGGIGSRSSGIGGIGAGVDGVGVIVSADMPAMPDVRQFGKDAWRWAQGTLQPAYQQNFWAYNWPYVICMLLFLLFIIFFIIAIAKMANQAPIAQNTGLRPL
jgi:hypothetical protein